MGFILLLVLLWVVLGAIGLTIYLIPTILAFKIRHPSRWLILVVNALGGWTVLGWFVLLFLVLSSGRALAKRAIQRQEGQAPVTLTKSYSGRGCSNCKDAYLSGKDICPDCGGALDKRVVVAADNRAKILLLFGALVLTAIMILIANLIH